MYRYEDYQESSGYYSKLKFRYQRERLQGAFVDSSMYPFVDYPNYFTLSKNADFVIHKMSDIDGVTGSFTVDSQVGNAEDMLKKGLQVGYYGVLKPWVNGYTSGTADGITFGQLYTIYTTRSHKYHTPINPVISLTYGTSSSIPADSLYDYLEAFLISMHSYLANNTLYDFSNPILILGRTIYNLITNSAIHSTKGGLANLFPSHILLAGVSTEADLFDDSLYPNSNFVTMSDLTDNKIQYYYGATDQYFGTIAGVNNERLVLDTMTWQQFYNYNVGTSTSYNPQLLVWDTQNYSNQRVITNNDDNIFTCEHITMLNDVDRLEGTVANVDEEAYKLIEVGNFMLFRDLQGVYRVHQITETLVEVTNGALIKQFSTLNVIYGLEQELVNQDTANNVSGNDIKGYVGKALNDSYNSINMNISIGRYIGTYSADQRTISTSSSQIGKSVNDVLREISNTYGCTFTARVVANELGDLQDDAEATRLIRYIFLDMHLARGRNFRRHTLSSKETGVSISNVSISEDITTAYNALYITVPSALSATWTAYAGFSDDLNIAKIGGSDVVYNTSYVKAYGNYSPESLNKGYKYKYWDVEPDSSNPNWDDLLFNQAVEYLETVRDPEKIIDVEASVVIDDIRDVLLVGDIVNLDLGGYVSRVWDDSAIGEFEESTAVFNLQVIEVSYNITQQQEIRLDIKLGNVQKDITEVI